eukprot:CAMPEP_0179426184 /NCGR_PEP_ID=MMETSP0799-20121207/12594_1 /TAXON_ID=46947 /ORGANISM="Geminigera cryophila, Strain CCMP2564" /LENGTH=258 /DNA_ID=CAMNT_0021200901 /DNA_START=120 /DNA_END=896 /DNA_ORIENTATION=+
MSKGTEEEDEDDEAIEDTTCRQQMQKQPTAMLWENNDPDRPGLRHGPKAAAHLMLRKFQDALINKEVKVGSLWEGRTACVMLMPDLKSIRSRDMLLSAALMQVHLHKCEVRLCLIFPTSNPKFAHDCAQDFSLKLDNVEIYADTTEHHDVFQAFGCMHLPRTIKRTFSQKLEALGYYTLRACCGPAHQPVCCVSGFGCSENTDILGGVLLLGPGDKMRYRCMDEDGSMLVDTDTILQQVTKVSVSQQQTGAAMVYVSV